LVLGSNPSGPILLVALLILSGCSTCQFKSSEDYYKDRQKLREDSIDWGPNSNNNMMDSPDGSVYYNRTIHVFGATY